MENYRDVISGKLYVNLEIVCPTLDPLLHCWNGIFLFFAETTTMPADQREAIVAPSMLFQ
nr:hypothetical protein [uncultured Sphaerochaeta sp.]